MQVDSSTVTGHHQDYDTFLGSGSPRTKASFMTGILGGWGSSPIMLCFWTLRCFWGGFILDSQGTAINSVDDKAVIAEIESHEIRNVPELGVIQ